MKINDGAAALMFGLLLGAGGMYTYQFRAMSMLQAYSQGKVDIMQLVCPPVTEAVMRAQQEAAKKQDVSAVTPKGPKAAAKEE